MLGYQIKSLKLRRWGVLLVLTLIVLALGSGCSSGPKVKSLDLQIREVNPESGLQIVLLPTDSKGRLIEAEGGLTITLWEQSSDSSGNATKGEQLEAWIGQSLTLASYYEYLGNKMGAIVDLKYSKEHPRKRGVYGIIEATLRLTDGTEVTVRKNDIMIYEKTHLEIDEHDEEGWYLEG
jgi:hypothetical protein